MFGPWTYASHLSLCLFCFLLCLLSALYLSAWKEYEVQWLAVTILISFLVTVFVVYEIFEVVAWKLDQVFNFGKFQNVIFEKYFLFICRLILALFLYKSLYGDSVGMLYCTVIVTYLVLSRNKTK